MTPSDPGAFVRAPVSSLLTTGSGTETTCGQNCHAAGPGFESRRARLGRGGGWSRAAHVDHSHAAKPSATIANNRRIRSTGAVARVED